MDTANLIKILNETVCILHSANTLEEGMNSIILFPAVNNQQGRLSFF